MGLAHSNASVRHRFALNNSNTPGAEMILESPQGLLLVFSTERRKRKEILILYKTLRFHELGVWKWLG
jgi:hypothetical protein